jgi:hypothetical protein
MLSGPLSEWEAWPSDDVCRFPTCGVVPRSSGLPFLKKQAKSLHYMGCSEMWGSLSGCHS